ncbi:unnamed protein product [Ceutorhynchus assimilis]|uniref:Sulfotransferase domain-containing protein n=1 Tax=Ceutorhynchus assimilis TaxID=467358 RepID=A0A9N9M8R2_9CUCU|nr:unnamed protein product [Ceutorhynchus assimilis]
MSEELFCLKAFDKQTINEGMEINYSTGDSFVQLGKYLAPPIYKNSAQKILDASVRKDDVCSKNYLIKHVDFVKCPNTGLSIPRYAKAVPSLEVLAKLDENIQNQLIPLFSDTLGFVDSLSSPRTIKSHLTFELLPEQLISVKPKIIYVIRNPKDVCVSFYFFCKNLLSMEIDFEHFCELFINDALIAGSIFKHYFSFWDRRHELDILILRYEEMKANTSEAIKQIATFIGKTLLDDDVKAISKYLSFSNMQKNNACNLKRNKPYFAEKELLIENKTVTQPKKITESRLD